MRFLRRTGITSEARKPIIPLRLKILTAFLGILLFFGIFASYAILKVQRVKTSLEVLNSAYVPFTRAVTVLESFVSEEETLTPKGYRPGAQHFQDVMLQVKRLELSDRAEHSVATSAAIVRQFEARPIDPAERRLIAAIQNQLVKVAARFRDYNQMAIEYSDSYNQITPSERKVTKSRMNSLRKGNLLQLAAVAELIESRRKELAMASEIDQREIVLTLAVFGLILLAASASILVWINHLLAPVTELIRGAKTISTGNYRHRVPEPPGSEIGQLGSEFNLMAASLLEREKAMRQQSEEIDRLRLFKRNIVESIRLGILVVNNQDEVTYANRAIGGLFGVDPVALVGKELERLPFLASIAPRLQEAIQHALHGQVRPLGVCALCREGESPFQAEVTCIPLVDEHGEGAGAIVIFEDMTEREATKARLIRSERMAAIGQMTAQVTHEVRNPLASISLNVELLRDELARLREEFTVGPKGAEAERLLNSIEREIARLNGLTEEYLQYARLPAAPPIRSDINRIIAETVAFHREFLQHHGVEADIRFGEPSIEADVNPQQLRQVLINLINNAVAAMEAGGRLVLESNREGLWVRITVRDTGHGIQEENLARIFDPFYTTRDTGTGLGLPLSRQIIEQLGGRIDVVSRVGAGTAFTIDLPAVP